MTNGRIDYSDMEGGLGNGCGHTLLMYGIIIIGVLMLLCGCRSVESAETSSENRRVSELVDRMDSLFRSTSTWQQDLYSKQSSLVDSFRQSERRDSSHTVVLNEKGDTVKERIVIYREVEKDHSLEKEVSEMWMQRFEQVDSMLRVSVARQERTDSLLREHEKNTVTQKEPTLWERVRQWLGDIAMMAIIAFMIVILFRYIVKKLPRRQ